MHALLGSSANLCQQQARTRATAGLACLRALDTLALASPAAVGGYLYLRSSKAPAPTPGCGCSGRHGSSGDGAAASKAEEAAADGQATFDRIADLYDSCVNTDETFMGIKLMRRWLVRHAQVSPEHSLGMQAGRA